MFPGLISLKGDETVWQIQSEYEYTKSFGWILKCTHLEQFFSSRFLQVLLLRLAFSFALDTECGDSNQSIVIHRNCYLWKNGIFWGNVFGMQTLVEVTTDNKSVIFLACFRKTNLLQCIKYRSQVISTILHCKEQFCRRVQTMELFVDSSFPIQYPLNVTGELKMCTIQNLATAVVADCECPSVVFQCHTISAENFLSFEPYLEMKLSTIQEIWNKKKEKEVISEQFLSDFVQQASEQLYLLIKNITGNTARIVKDDEIYQNLLKWRNNDMDNQKSYGDLRQLVDQYSVFAGRNILVSLML